MLNETFCLFGSKSTQPADRSNTLPQLSECGTRQFVRQTGLSDQDNLQQLGLGRLEIGKQSNRLQHRRIEVLSFVNHHNEAPAGARFLYQAAVELIVHADKILRIALDAKLRQQESHELTRSALGLKKKRRAG